MSYTIIPDGSIKCTLLGPDGGAIDESLSFTMRALPSGDENSLETIRAAADEFVQQAMDTVEEHSDQLQDSLLDHLTDMYEK